MKKSSLRYVTGINLCQPNRDKALISWGPDKQASLQYEYLFRVSIFKNESRLAT